MLPREWTLMGEITPTEQRTPKASVWWRRILDWLLGFHGTPDQVARGIAIGTFVAFTPLEGLQMMIAVFLATITYSNRPAAMAMVWITNPITAVPIYLATYRIGRYFTPGYPPLDLKRRLTAVMVDEQGEWFNFTHQLRELASLGTSILVPLTIGGVIVGIVLGAIAYVITRTAVKIARERFANRHSSEPDKAEAAKAELAAALPPTVPSLVESK
jgi:uncharacterized protein (DUF2062 family)